MAEDKSSKTEEPTARRLSKAREEGQVAKSTEVNTFAVLMAGLFILFFAGPFIYNGLADTMTGTLSRLHEINVEGPNLTTFLIGIIKKMALLLSPVLIGVAIVGLLVNVAQVGVVFSAKSLEPKLDKLNFIKGLGKLFSKRSLVELVKSIGKIAIIAGIAYLTVRGEMSQILLLGDMSPAEIAYYVLKISFELFLKTLWIFALLAVLDLAYQKWQMHQDLKMTKEEVKEEFKQTEGDPLVKSRIRSAQRDASRKRMMAAVPTADVVVTNPTHLAVALKYDPKQADAPMVVAKGQALLAEKIKKIAAEYDVAVIEDKPLAQSLYKMVEVGDVIPFIFYQAVAELLAYVYRLKGKKVHGGVGR